MAVLLLVFVSGAAALVYEVLWVRELGLLLGNTAHASAMTLAAFFLGVSAGSWFIGTRADRVRRPLIAYAALEIGIAVTAVAGFVGLRAVQNGPAGFVFLLPPTILMGGTLPVAIRCLVSDATMLGRTGSRVHGVNTLGAAAGAWLAGIHLPVWFGVAGSVCAAAGANALVAVFAIVTQRAASSAVEPSALDAPVPPVDAAARPLGPGILLAVAAASGFFALALEVLWTRMFAQVLQNSVYSFAAVLVVFLLALAIGAGVAGRLGRLRAPEIVLASLLVISGALVAVTPPTLDSATDGLVYVGGSSGFVGYVIDVVRLAGMVLLPAGIALGAVFPFLLRLAQGTTPHHRIGATVGRLAGISMFGGVAGSLAAGFLLLPTLGLWPAIRALAFAYVGLGITIGMRTARRRAVVGGGLLAATAIIIALRPGALPLIHLADQERLVETRYGAHGVASVTLSGDRNYALRLNNSYRLGSVFGTRFERRLGHIPLLSHPAPKSVYCIGLATGITAGAVLDHDPERVVVAELVPEVEILARRWFGSHANGLFDDPRVEIVAEDGRHRLATDPTRYDAILCDLVLPWQARTGYLYTREFYELVDSRLETGGVFAQWFDLKEWTAETFAVAARTLAGVFPHATVWRSRSDPVFPVVGIVASRSGAPLDPAVFAARSRGLAADFPTLVDVAPDARTLLGYAGSLHAMLGHLPATAKNTDDRPVLEYLAPVAIRRISSGEESYLAHGELETLFSLTFRTLPVASDPYLARLSEKQKDYVRAGLSWYRWRVYEHYGFTDAAAQAYLDGLARLGLAK